MADVAVKLHLQPGTGPGNNTAPPDPDDTKKWVRATLKDGGGNSDWWFYYSGGAGTGGTAGGEVDLPTGGSFSISPSGNEVITSVVINETATPPAGTSYYSPNPPTADANGTYTITDTNHDDPPGKNDSFDVYAKFNTASAEVKCDPIIRNRGD